MAIKTKQVPPLEDLDGLILAERWRWQEALKEARFADVFKHMRLAHRYQVLRYKAYGACLPHSDGKIYVFDTTTERFTRYDNVTFAPA
jgi:hypothetical protein